MAVLRPNYLFGDSTDYPGGYVPPESTSWTGDTPSTGDGVTYTPAARFDVVPYQRVVNGETMNIGVVAFSKDGVEKVDFTISGQGYASGTKTATTMSENSRTGVWEYWVEVSSSEFSSNGAFTISAVVTAKNGGTRNLSAIQLVVDADGGLSQNEAWVTSGGNDSTGTVNDDTLPFASVAAAADALYSAGSSDTGGATIYVGTGTWNLGSTTTNTAVNEWLTITHASSTTKANVVFNGTGSFVDNVGPLRFYDVTIAGTSEFDQWLQGWPDPQPTYLWVDNCKVTGSGRHDKNSNPAWRNENFWSTDSEYTTMDVCLRFCDLSRGDYVHTIGDDAFFMCDCVINAQVEDQDNEGVTINHTDAWQRSDPGLDNQIVYGYRGSDLHLQGLFIRSYPSAGPHVNSAFVNVFMEMREPGRPGTVGGDPDLKTGYFAGHFDHVLVWNCSFVGPNSAWLELAEEGDGIGFGMTNCSFIGSTFPAMIYWPDAGGTDPAFALPGNSENNDFLECHYEQSYVDNGDPDPLRSISPDSDSDVSQTIGEHDIDLTVGSADFGKPATGSVLIARFDPVVPVDVLNNVRPASCAVGAYEP